MTNKVSSKIFRVHIKKREHFPFLYPLGKINEDNFGLVIFWKNSISERCSNYNNGQKNKEASINFGSVYSQILVSE